jgi:1-acyl-sn-glycerol-3-phosphate acyltransferase
MSKISFRSLRAQIPKQFVGKRNKFSRWLGVTVLKVLGWRIEGTIPNQKRLIVIGAPHTSNWDFILAMGTILGLNLRMRWMAKHTIFKPGITWFMEWLGGIPTDRNNPRMVVDHVARLAEKENGVIIGITPEGTRKKVDKWKTGFLRIAEALDCPILMVGLHFPNKIITLGEVFYPSGDNDSDLLTIKHYYEQFRGRHPSQF